MRLYGLIASVGLYLRKKLYTHLAKRQDGYIIFAEEEQRRNVREQATLCVACLREVKSVVTRHAGEAFNYNMPQHIILQGLRLDWDKI